MVKEVDPLVDLKSAMPVDTKGIVPTLNRTGIMLETLTPCSQSFAEYAGQCEGEVLDIGCAYGVATVAALEQGARVLAMDMAQPHLDILAERIRKEAKHRLVTQKGLLPDIDFEEERFGAIHASRVIHFLTPEDVQKSLQKMYRWLQPGGKLFLVSDSPYVGYWASKASEYEARKAAGDLWPGYIDDVSKYFNKKDIDGAPSIINPLDPDIFSRECIAVGFDIEKVEFFEAPGIDLEIIGAKKTGREHAGIVAVKPTAKPSQRSIDLLPIGSMIPPSEEVLKSNEKNEIGSADMVRSQQETQPLAEFDLRDVNTKEIAEEIRSTLRKGLAAELCMETGTIDDQMPFTEMGLDSISGVTWIRKINTRYGLSISATQVYKHPTIHELASYILNERKQQGLSLSTSKESTISLPVSEDRRPPQSTHDTMCSKNEDNPKMLKQQIRKPIQTLGPRFPELVHLNQVSQGRPVFWFHGGHGGVNIYREIAQKSQRPFYGIQPRGWMTDRSPLQGIQAMAAYYVNIIQSTDPEGPYDLGGFSLGGMLAYEVTRQLQELGQTVNSIVMLDSLDKTVDEAVLKEMKFSQKNRILQAINTALLSTITEEPEKIVKTLIHRDEVNSNLDDNAFLEQLITLAKARRLTKTKEQLHTTIQQCANVQQAYELDRFSVLPLTNPSRVTCYYFRNKSGVFMGELGPYFNITSDEVSFDNKMYWQQWEHNLPRFHMMDVEASNHMMLLSETKVRETILAFCEKLYSKRGMSPQFLTTFKKKTKKTKEISSSGPKIRKKTRRRKNLDKTKE